MKDNTFVVSIERVGYRCPRLIVRVEHRTTCWGDAETFIVEKVMEAFNKRKTARWGKYKPIRVLDYRIVDAQGLKYLRAAEKGSVTRRRKLAAKKGAATRARNSGRTLRSLSEPYRPVH